MTKHEPGDDELIKKAFSQGEGTLEKLIFRRNRALETILLLLALPVLIPSLLINFLMAKRWGRIDFALLAIDGFIILLFCMGSFVYFMIALIALLSSACLYILRHKKIPYGIFLGYSNTVAMLLMIGGIIFGIGYFKFVPWSTLNRITTTLGSEKKIVVRNIMNNQVDAYTKIVVDDARLDWDARLYRVHAPDGEKFMSFDLESGNEMENPAELWEKRDELIGTTVTVNQQVFPTDSYKRNSIEIERTKGGPKETDRITRLFALVSETDGRVWVATGQLPGEDENAFFEKTSHTGTLVGIYTDGAQGRWYNANYGKNLPYMGVAVMPQEKATAAPGVEDSKPLDTWIPVKETRSSFWAVFPGKLTEKPTSSVKGMFEGRLGAPKELSDYLALHPPEDYRSEAISALMCVAPADYMKKNNLIGKFLSGFQWYYMLFLLPGFGIIIFALFIAKEE